MPSEDEDRREFLKTCGKFAAVTPPAMTSCFPPPSRQTLLRTPEVEASVVTSTTSTTTIITITTATKI